MTLNTRQAGFTLIELMLAMLIFALIGIASSLVLNQMLDSDQRSSERREQLESLQFAMLLIERDVRQMVARPVRSVPQEYRNRYFTNDGRDIDSDGDGMAFVRAGWSNPGATLPRSMLQPVVYRVREGVLQRLSNEYVDDVSGRPRIQDLLEGVENFEVRMLHQGEEYERWAIPGDLPEVVIVRLTLADYGVVERWLLTSGRGLQ